jgi:hypothetical protein
MVDQEKQAKVTCYNYAQWGHFSTNCQEPRQCFICQTTDHVGRDYLEWLKPLEPAQYLGSAAQGIGFFHVEVSEEVDMSGFLKFLDNYVVLTVEEGFIEEHEIVESLQKIFDQNWQWQLKEIEDFRYLVSPPHKQLTSTLISDTTNFKMKKGWGACISESLIRGC